MGAWVRLGCAAAMVVLGQGTPAQAETLRIAGIYPAQVDEAAALHAIAVSRFRGEDGARLAFLIEDRLREAEVGGAPWFAVLVPELANEADATLRGYAQPQFSESRFKQKRKECVARDDKGECTERAEVEADCIRVSARIRPELRLAAADGRLIWSGEPLRTQDFDYCPMYDEAPKLDPVIDRWLESIADEVRRTFAPRAETQDLRLMESADGLAKPARNAFRAAIRQTRADPAGACAAIAALLANNPASPSLTFDAGLCAEQGGDFDGAAALYRAALAFSRSDDEAQAGLDRLAQRRRAERQVEEHAAADGPAHTSG